MEEGFIDVEKRAKVLELFDQAVAKLRAYVLDQVLPAVNATPEKIYEIKTLMSIDSLLFLPPIRDFLKSYYDQILARDVDFFRAIFPKEFENVQIPSQIIDKGVLFAKVFHSLLKDIDQ